MGMATSATTCRAACHLARTIVQFLLLDSSQLNESVENLLLLNGSNGPALFCDSSLALWTVTADQRAAEIPGSTGNLGFEMMFKWMQRRWEPGKLEKFVTPVPCS